MTMNQDKHTFETWHLVKVIFEVDLEALHICLTICTMHAHFMTNLEPLKIHDFLRFSRISKANTKNNKLTKKMCPLDISVT